MKCKQTNFGHVYGTENSDVCQQGDEGGEIDIDLTWLVNQSVTGAWIDVLADDASFIFKDFFLSFVLHDFSTVF